MTTDEMNLADRSRYVRQKQLLGQAKRTDEPDSSDEIPGLEESRIVYDEPQEEWEPY